MRIRRKIIHGSRLSRKALARLRVSVLTMSDRALRAFVLLVPFLLVLGSLVSELGSMRFVSSILSAAAREGALAAQSAVPSDREAGQCSALSCDPSVSDACCAAIRRAELIVRSSGLGEALISAEWVTDTLAGKRRVLYGVTASARVPFLFGLLRRSLQARSTAYENTFSGHNL